MTIRLPSWKLGNRSAGKGSEARAHLLLRGAVDPRVGYRPLPFEQVAVLIGETLEGSALEGVGLDVLHAAFDVTLVTRRAWLGGQDHRAVVAGTPPKCQNAFSNARMNSSVLWRQTTSLYALREWLSTMRNA